MEPPRSPEDGTGRRARAWWQARRGRLVRLWGVGLAASLLVTGASALGYLESLQARTLDLLQRLGGQRFPSEVVIVAIDDAAFESLGGRQPIPRDYLARLVRALRRSGAAVVGLDVALTAATDAASDGALARAILDFGQDGVSRVVLVEPPPPSGPLGDAAFVRAVLRGSDRVPVDPDGVIRRAAFLVPQGAGSAVPALSLAVLARLAEGDSRRLEAARHPSGSLVALPVWQGDGAWGTTAGGPVPVRPGELWRIAFVGPQKSVLTISSDAVAPLSDDASPVAEDNPLRGRVVLVGATFQESRDFFQTPHGPLPGVEVHANLVHMLATRTFIRPSGWLTSLAIQAGVVLIAGVLLVLLRPLAGTLVALGLTLLIGIPGSYLALHGGGYAVDFVLPALGTCALGVAAEILARRRLHDSFGRYVGREVMAQVLAEDPSLRGDRREVSILVSDIRGFTTLAETLPAEAVAARLNEYFPAMMEVIFAHRGMINDFVGDGIMAIFGAPLRDPDHAWHAVRSAVAMEQALAALNRRWAGEGLPLLRMGIGIHSGAVFAGNVGGAARVKYTVVGDAVNVAARLEGLNKELGTTVLLTEETRAALGDRLDARFRGEVLVKGRTRPLQVYELLALPSEG
ncbi:MAG: adenylate/guanylate cyclase domain-containing protein [Candidatus Rokubacteria bacterium]|nr:adenylate/guanylate cyclase domain-containing protein [Candidatus Rokubacteria bacterium]